jgi:hypothetical protein
MSLIANKIPFDWQRWLPRSHRRRELDPRVLVALSFGGVCILTLLRAIWRDYRTYMTYGPGELPYSVKGWFISSVIMRPFGTDVLSTTQYDSDSDKRSWLSPDWPRRIRDPRPSVGPHPIPHRQVDQEAPLEIQLVYSCLLNQEVRND